jgi:type II secretory pathway component GspD/PulD (secretin)
LIGSLFQRVSKEREKVDFIIFLTPQIIRDAAETRDATRQAANASFNPARPSLSPIETEVDRRLREIYEKSLKKGKK